MAGVRMNHKAFSASVFSAPVLSASIGQAPALRLIRGRIFVAAMVGALLPHVAIDVTPAVVPDTNHWILDENPNYVLGILTTFLRR